MNFLSVLKKIAGIGATVEHIAAPILSLAEPQFAPIIGQVDNWVTRTQAAVLSAESTITQAKAGGLKQAAVIADFENGLQTAQAALAISGKTIQYDVDKYKKVIADFVAAYNDAADFKTTWKIVDLPKTVA